MLEINTEQAGCPICGGLGYESVDICTSDGEYMGTQTEMCNECDGKGWVVLVVEVHK